MQMSEEIARAWHDYKTNRCQIALRLLVETYLPLVNALARRRAAKVPKSVEIGDIIQAGLLGLLDAIDSYSLDRQTSFKTFSSTRIWGAMVDESRNLDWLPRQVRSRARQVESAKVQLQAELSRPATEEELCQRTGLSPTDYGKLTRHLRAATARSIGHTEGGDSAIETVQLPADHRAADPARAAQRGMLKDAITQGLCRSERLIVTLYYYENLSMREIGLVLDLSESRVSQMHSHIIQRLKAKLANSSQRVAEMAA